MDAPGMKCTYTATVLAPEWTVVLMSALQDASIKSSNVPKGWIEYRFTQPVPVSTYLIALAAGDLASRDVSERVRVWAEPSVVDSAAFEFAETEEFLKTAESIVGPYSWGRYDILCLPPSSPYGGMENPCLTFVTPTLLAGDRSLADVVAHEAAHSWTGNLVTNHTWEHFWLNEGWTVWLERKIMAKIRNNDQVSLLSAQIGWNHLVDDVARFREAGLLKFTSLVWPAGGDPDEAFSSVPYEKGFWLLHLLEGMVGSQEFETFAKDYISRFKFATVTSGDFAEMFRQRFCNNPDVQTLDWALLLEGTGLPPTPDYSNQLATTAHSLAEGWFEGKVTSGTAVDMQGWTSQQTCVFLEQLDSLAVEAKSVSGRAGVLPVDLLTALDAAYSLSERRNSEIKFRWLGLCLKAGLSSAVPKTVAFLSEQGRMKVFPVGS